tara:strand:- start:29 stop:376 length:348 start_codon:yes stop_codon:yes gene_type:complete
MSVNKIFYNVQKHLLKQNKQARNEVGSCQYRNDSGLSCAVGCLIPDQMYRSHANIEGSGVSDLPPDVLTPIIGVQYAKAREKLDLLGGLQHIHDNDQPSAWPEKLAKIKLEFDIS